VDHFRQAMATRNAKAAVGSRDEQPNGVDFDRSGWFAYWLPLHVVDGLLLLLLVVVVSASIARHRGAVARSVLLGSALVISAALFLPSSLLVAVVGADALAALESVAGTYAWTLAAAAHFIAFVWLALVLWTLRPDLCGPKAIAVMVILAVAAELMQGLSTDRSTRRDDIGVNLVGVWVGLVLAVVIAALRGWRCGCRHCGEGCRSARPEPKTLPSRVRRRGIVE